MLIDRSFCFIHDACYTDEELSVLLEEPVPLEEILTRTGGAWDDVSEADRLWVFFRAIERQQLLNWLALLVERTFGRVKNPPEYFSTILEALRTDSVTEESLILLATVPFDDAVIRVAHHACFAASEEKTFLPFVHFAANAAVTTAHAHVVSTYVDNTDPCDADFHAIAQTAGTAQTAERKQQIQDALRVLNG